VSASLLDALPRGEECTADQLLARFLEVNALRGLSLYPAQEEALLELWDDKNLILNTPTGSGKSLVASGLHFLSLARGRRSVYTCPVKALVNEKWMALCREFGPENVGLSTGDATVNHGAPILCCTAEILSNMALSEGEDCPVADVVMDEFHYYSDRQRGVAWQIPLLTLPRARFLLMSATLGDTAFFEQELTRRTGRSTATVKSVHRPVPLEFDWSDHPLPNAVQGLVTRGKSPVYVVHFTQADAARNAQNFTSLDLCSKEEKAKIAHALEGFRFSSPYGPDLKRWLKQGIGLHHAGLLPKYRILAEKLAQQGLLKIICGTDTLGVGVNVPIRTVLFTQLCKWNGDKTSILSSRDFHQIGGRAGRKGFDDIGYVVAQAPEHVIENLKLAAKAGESGRKFQKQKPPEKGYVPWDEQTFRKLIDSSPEPLKSSFAVSHGMLLNILSRPTDGCQALRDLIRGCHEGPKDKIRHRDRAFQLFRPLVDRGIVEFIPPQAPGMAKLRVKADLGEDFSMDHALALWLLDTIPLLDVQSPEYPLDLLTLVESILEDPDLLLRKQLEKEKSRLIAQWKAEGVEYDERMARLQEVEYPKPQREFVYGTFNAFAEKHPWVGNDNIRPKSIAREMFEGFRTFSDYVKEYELQRSEGLLLRHLNATWRVLAQTVPDSAKTEEVREMEEYLAAMLRQVDSSLLEEWERLKNPAFVAEESQELRPPGAEEAARDITRDPKAFLAMVRTRIFSFLGSWSAEEFEEALDLLASEPDESEQDWTAIRLRERREAFREANDRPRLDAEGRNLRHTHLEKAHDSWRVEQAIQDLSEHNDWSALFSVDLSASRERAEPVMRLLRLAPL
jgi:superfamily II RNA helicase